MHIQLFAIVMAVNGDAMIAVFMKKIAYLEGEALWLTLLIYQDSEMTHCDSDSGLLAAQCIKLALSLAIIH